MGLLTVDEVAEQLRLTPTVTRRWLQQGKLPGLKIGREWRIDEKDLEKFIEEAKNKR